MPDPSQSLRDENEHHDREKERDRSDEINAGLEEEFEKAENFKVAFKKFAAEDKYDDYLNDAKKFNL